MTRQRVPLSMCSRDHKKSYPTQRAAIRFALVYSKKRGTPLRTYKCQTCGGWHLTHTRKRGWDE